MNARHAMWSSWVIALGLACVPSIGHAKDLKGDKPVSGEKMQPGEKNKPAAKDSTSAAAPPAPKVYRYKSEKKSAFGGGQAMALTLEDALTGKVETLFVQSNDPASKDYNPLTSVESSVKELKPGDLVQVETEKVKSKQVVTSVSKADIKPGEEERDGFVFIDQQTVQKGGTDNLIVTLSKFGREVKVGVPMMREKNNNAGGGKGKSTGNGDWRPDPKLDYVLQKVQNGTVVIAAFKMSNNTPMLTSIYEYRKPERGQFVELKEVEFNSHKAAGFVIKAEDGTDITFTLEGREQSKNGEKMYVPNPDQLAAVKRLKPNQEVEVHYRLDGRSWMLHDLKVLNTGDKDKSTAKADGNKMDDDSKMKSDKSEKTAGKSKEDKPAKEDAK